MFLETELNLVSGVLISYSFKIDEILLKLAFNSGDWAQIGWHIKNIPNNHKILFCISLMFLSFSFKKIYLKAWNHNT